ncbi:MAG: Uncharacterised protein [Prochlorococcus marinus str. MIT 9215]|nr:MAG: Uncharacterised protein [Prochlorococcus marinus str. MIT 9215]
MHKQPGANGANLPDHLQCNCLIRAVWDINLLVGKVMT